MYIILIAKLDGIAPIERVEVGFNFVDESLQGDVRPRQTFVSSLCAITNQCCFLGRHQLNVKTETKLYFVAYRMSLSLLTPAFISLGFYFSYDYRETPLCSS